MPRKIWVTTTSLLGAGGPTVQDNLERARILLEQACATRPDIVCLPETVAYYGVEYTRAEEVAQPAPGPLTDMAAALARRHNTYIICPLLEQRGEEIFNAAVLLDRRGAIVGIYEKIHPVASREYTLLEKGVTPGIEPKVFDADFGRIGILICFDINWPQEWATLKEMGAEIVFWPSAYDGGLPLQARAIEHHYYIVSSVRKDHARIIDMTGKVLVETGLYNAFAEAQIDLEKKVFSTDYNLEKLAALRAKYGRAVEAQVCLDEDIFTLESHRADVTVADLAEEFGLTPWDEYIARSTAAQDAQRDTFIAHE
jgi:predicted amidohydrolase